MTDYKALREAIAKASSPLPWSVLERGAYWNGEEADIVDATGADVSQAEFIEPPGNAPTTRGQMPMPDAELAVAAVNAAPALLAELDALREDAERYRCLRGDAPSYSARWARFELRYWTGQWWEPLQLDALDAAIDAARKEPHG